MTLEQLCRIQTAGNQSFILHLPTRAVAEDVARTLVADGWSIEECEASTTGRWLRAILDGHGAVAMFAADEARSAPSVSTSRPWVA